MNRQERRVLLWCYVCYVLCFVVGWFFLRGLL